MQTTEQQLFFYTYTLFKLASFEIKSNVMFQRLESFTAALTKFDIRAGFAALVGVQDQEANFEEEAVWGHVETTHLVEAVTADHQCNEAYSFTQNVNVMNNPIDSCLGT